MGIADRPASARGGHTVPLLPSARCQSSSARSAAWSSELVLFAVTGDVPAAVVRESLRRALPAYMVPASVQLVDTIPTTANGKVDRPALPIRDPDRHRPGPDRNGRVQDEVEQRLAEIWVGLLGLPAIQPSRSILEYGAHSIMMFNSLTQINAAYDIDLTIVDLFTALTIAELSTVVRERLADS